MAVQIDFDPKQAAAIGFVWELLVALLLPIAVCAFAGRWLDRRFVTSPLFFALSFPVSLAIAFKLIREKAEELKRELYSTPEPSEKDPKDPPS